MLRFKRRDEEINCIEIIYLAEGWLFFPAISLLSNSVVGRVVAYPFIALFITILSEVENQSVSCCACQSEMQSSLDEIRLCCCNSQALNA